MSLYVEFPHVITDMTSCIESGKFISAAVGSREGEYTTFVDRWILGCDKLMPVPMRMRRRIFGTKPVDD